MELSPPVPELPVRDVAKAQAYYRDRLGFEVAWHNEEAGLGAVSLGPCAVFFRQHAGAIHPVTLWIFAPDVDGAYDALTARGAAIIDPIANKPWGLRQFSLRDLDGHIVHIHHDL